MRVLLDECVPKRLRRDLPGFDVSTVADEGWLGRRNGDLLRSMAEAGFTHLVTVDRNLGFQQNVAAAGVAIPVMKRAVSTSFSRIAEVGSRGRRTAECWRCAGAGQWRALAQERITVDQVSRSRR